MRISLWSCLLRTLWLSVVAALAVPVVIWALNPQTKFKVLSIELGYAFLYSISIGLPLSLALPLTWQHTYTRKAWARISARAGVVLAGDFAGCLLAGFVIWIISGGRLDFWDEMGGAFPMAVLISFVIFVLISVYEAQRAKLHVTAMQLKVKELERERALKLATEARLSSLESRMRPHFLFNTINSISALIHDDPQRAEAMLSQMAELLRFSLDSTQCSLVPLEREIRIVQDYLEIERARFNGRLRYEIQIPPELQRISVPPLSVQTLVENSVKYAVSPRRQGATIRVEAAYKGDYLILSVTDDGPGFTQPEMPAGHGLNTLQDRLAALFGERARLSIASAREACRVSIEIPLTRETAIAAGVNELAAVKS